MTHAKSDSSEEDTVGFKGPEITWKIICIKLESCKIEVFLLVGPPCIWTELDGQFKLLFCL